MSYDPPTLNAVTLPRPNTASRKREDVYQTKTIANGREVRYVQGYRYVYTLGWTRTKVAERDAIAAASNSLGDVPLVWVDGTTGTVRTSSPLEESLVPGTDPTVFDLTLELREPGVRT